MPVFHALAYLVELFIFVLIVRALLSWFPLQPGTELARVAGLLARITEPVLAPIRKLLPPIRAGGMAIDLSFLIVVILAQVLVIPLLYSL